MENVVDFKFFSQHAEKMFVPLVSDAARDKNKGVPIREVHQSLKQGLETLLYVDDICSKDEVEWLRELMELLTPV